MAMSAAAQAAIRAMGMVTAQRHLQQNAAPVEIKIPKRPPLHPKEWVCMSNVTVLTSSGALRFSRGDRFTDAVEVGILRDAGADIRAIR